MSLFMISYLTSFLSLKGSAFYSFPIFFPFLVTSSAKDVELLGKKMYNNT